MSNPQTIENKISAVKKYLGYLEFFKKYSQKEIEENLLVKGAVERYLYLATQATIDLAEAFLAFKNFRKPTTLREPFYILNEENIISVELSEKLSDMAGFRNIVAHDYEKMDYAIIVDIVQNKLKDIQDFIEVIEGQI